MAIAKHRASDCAIYSSRLQDRGQHVVQGTLRASPFLA
jgi:hypothetical protein